MGESEDSDLSSVGRALDCREYRYRAVPGSIPGGRMLFYFIYLRVSKYGASTPSFFLLSDFHLPVAPSLTRVRIEPTFSASLECRNTSLRHAVLLV